MAINVRDQKICVLGGTGFVGRALDSLLLTRGYTLVVPTRSLARHRDLLVLPDLELVPLDVHDEDALTGALRGCTAAVNLVGILNERGRDGSGFAQVHVELAQKVVRACKRAAVPRLLQMSALKASAELGPSHYLRSKGQAERAIAALAGADLHYTIFRPSVIFGPDDSFTNRFAALLRRLPVLPLPGAEARFAPVFVGDVVQAFAAVLEDSATFGKTYELCGPDIFSLREVVSYVRWALGVKRLILPMPPVLARVQAWLGDYVLPGKPFSLDNLRSLGVASICTQDGLAALGINPQSLPAVLPTYLGGRSRERFLAALRSSARD